MVAGRTPGSADRQAAATEAAHQVLADHFSDDKNSELFGVTELCNAFDVTPRTLRFYEDEKLIAPGRRGQTRLYSSRDRARIILILRGRRLGFSLAEIRELFDMYDTDRSSKTQLNSMIQLIEAKRHSLRQQLEDIQMVMAELEAAEQRCVNSLNSLKTSAD